MFQKKGALYTMEINIGFLLQSLFLCLYFYRENPGDYDGQYNFIWSMPKLGKKVSISFFLYLVTLLH